MPASLRRLVGIGAPLALAAVAWLLATRYLAPGVDVDAMGRGPLGPVTWPKAMLYCLMASALALCALRGWQALRPPAAATAVADEYHEARGGAGIALLIAYAWLVPETGFAIATFGFVTGWLLLGGLRRPLAILLTASVGTVALLYLFVKVSLMPLDRGRGAFETVTVALYRLLGIY